MKIHIILFLFLILFSTNCGSDDDTPPDSLREGLVADYPFDANARDNSFANDGEMIGDVQATTNRRGEANRALLFDGEGSHVRVPHSPAINFGHGQDFAISVWIKFNPGEQNQHVSTNNFLSKWCPSDSGESCSKAPYILRVSNSTSDNPGQIIGWRQDEPSCNNDSEVISASSTFGDGLFHHVLYQKSGNQLQIYVDGRFEAEEFDVTEDNCAIQNDSPLLVGVKRENNTGISFAGAIDDLKFYNRSLTLQEISSLSEE